MKIIFAIVLAASICFSQTRPFSNSPNDPRVLADPQPARDITIHLTADQATALETARLNTKKRDTDATTGVTTDIPRFANINALANALTRPIWENMVSHWNPEAAETRQIEQAQALIDRLNKKRAKKAAAK